MGIGGFRNVSKRQAAMRRMAMRVLRLGRPSISRLSVFVALLLCQIPTVSIAQDSTPNTDPVTHDDCEIIATVIVTQHAGPLSFASFGATCDWPKLGLTVTTTAATTGWRAYFRRPSYAVDHKRATVSYSNSYNGADGMYGSHAFDCTSEKQHGRWKVSVCSHSVIAN